MSRLIKVHVGLNPDHTCVSVFDTHTGSKVTNVFTAPTAEEALSKLGKVLDSEHKVAA